MTSEQAIDDDPMRERILRATFKVLSRHGYGKLNLSDVAAQAGISRPTLYKSFASKDELLAAFGVFEMQLLRKDFHRATDDRTGQERVEALLRFLADFYSSYQMRGLIEIEPGLLLDQMGKALPELVALIAPVLDGHVPDHEAVAMALVRLSVCHYLVPGFDDDRLLDQLRAAAGLPSAGD
jgi:TetR/AcrR family transcriptional regulator, repressor for uid operon